MDWLLGDAVKNFMGNAAEDAIALFLEVLTLINGLTLEILNAPVVNSVILYSQGLGLFLIGFNVTYQSWVNHAFRDLDDDSPEALAQRTVVAVIIVSIAPWLAKWLFNLGQAISLDIANLQGVDLGDITNNLQFLNQVLLHYSQYALYIGIAVIAAVILLIIVIVQSVYRSAQFAFNVIMGCVLSAMHVSQHSEHLGMWFREIIAIAATPVIQLIGIKIAFSMIASAILGTNSLLNLILFLVFLLVILKLPRTVSQFVHSTGTAKGAMSGAKFAAGLAIRKAMMK